MLTCGSMPRKRPLLEVSIESWYGIVLYMLWGDPSSNSHQVVMLTGDLGLITLFLPLKVALRLKGAILF